MSKPLSVRVVQVAFVGVLASCATPRAHPGTRTVPVLDPGLRCLDKGQWVDADLTPFQSELQALVNAPGHDMERSRLDTLAAMELLKRNRAPLEALLALKRDGMARLERLLALLPQQGAPARAALDHQQQLAREIVDLQFVIVLIDRDLNAEDMAERFRWDLRRGSREVRPLSVLVRCESGTEGRSCAFLARLGGYGVGVEPPDSTAQPQPPWRDPCVKSLLESLPREDEWRALARPLGLDEAFQLAQRATQARVESEHVSKLNFWSRPELRLDPADPSIVETVLERDDFFPSWDSNRDGLPILRTRSRTEALTDDERMAWVQQLLTSP